MMKPGALWSFHGFVALLLVILSGFTSQRSLAQTIVSLTLFPPEVAGGQVSSAVVTLSAAAPAGGVAVALSSDNSTATLPSSVTVGPGSTSATFSITSTFVTHTNSVTLSATWQGSTQTAILTIDPPRTSGGVVLGWGSNGQGELGVGTSGVSTSDRSADRSIAVPSVGLPVVRSVAVGDFHSMALGSDGSVWTWGAGSRGQLGQGTTVSSPIPARIPGLPSIGQIAAGVNDSLAVTTTGSLYAWGANDLGQVGNGSYDDALTPQLVSGVTGVVQASAGYGHSVAVATDGSVWSWGSDLFGQLGDGTNIDSPVPVKAVGLGNTPISRVSAGWSHTLALTTGGQVFSWGSNDSGQLGNGSTIDQSTPEPVQVPAGMPSLPAMQAISAGSDHSLALDISGNVWAWGSNAYGQLGDGTTTDHFVPTLLAGLKNVVAIEAGDTWSLALLSDGTVWAWGRNSRGQLGNGTTDVNDADFSADSLVPVQVTGLTASSIASGGSHALALGQLMSKVTITSSTNPSVNGQPVIFTGVVMAVNGALSIPTGFVDFTDAATDMGLVALNLGSAQIDLADTSMGTHPIVADYYGDSLFTAGQGTLTQQVASTTLSSIAVAPGSVTGGSSVSGTVTLATAAPTGDWVVSLSSDNASAMVPASVTVLAGQTSASFTVTTVPVAGVSEVTLQASSGGSTASTTLIINPPELTGFTVNPSTLRPAGSGAGTVTLNAVAPTGGTSVTLFSDSSSVTLPSNVVVAAGQTSASFTLTAESANQVATANLTASLDNTSIKLSVNIVPYRVTGLTITPVTAKGNSFVTGVVTIDAPAPAGGVPVTTTTNSVSAGSPGLVTVMEGQTSASFTVITSPVGLPTLVTVTASAGSASSTASVTLQPPALVSVALSPSTTAGGTSVLGTVTLDSPAPISGITIALQSNNAAASVLAVALITSSQTTAQFVVSTTGVLQPTPVTITAMYGSITLTASLTVTPAPITGFTLAITPPSVKGGESVSGQLTLAGVAPVGGVVIDLSSNNSSVVVPDSVTAAAGQTSISFIATTQSVAQPVAVIITGVMGTFTQAAGVTILPPDLTGMTAIPASLVGGASVSGQVTLDSPAPNGGMFIQMISDSPLVSPPNTVIVPAGQTTDQFLIATSPVAATTTVHIGAVLGTTTLSSAITLNPPVLSSVSVAPLTVAGGSDAFCTVTLGSPAPTGGMAIALSSDTGLAQAPATVTVPEMETFATATIHTSPTAQPITAGLTATLNGVVQTTSLVIDPPSVMSISLTPSSGPGGVVISGTVTLSGPGPVGGVVVDLSSDDAAAVVPGSITIPPGYTTGSFGITLTPVAQTHTAHIGGSFGGSSASAVLIINPPTLSGIALSPSSITGGGSVSGSVTLNGPAPVGGMTVSLESDNSVASVPAAVTITTGQVSAIFSVSALPVVSATILHITASMGDSNESSPLVVNPPLLSSASIAPTAILGGDLLTLTVALAGPAPASGIAVSLSSDNARVPVPTTFVVTGVSSSVSLSTLQVDQATSANVTVTLNGISKVAQVTLNPVPLAGLSVSPVSVSGGSPVIGMVTLSVNAPASGTVVRLSSTSATATVADTVTVAPGSTTASFLMTTIPTQTVVVATIMASSGGVSKGTTLTIRPPALVSLVVTPTSVLGSNQAAGTVTLDGPAPSGGMVVLVSTDAWALAPPSVTVAAGEKIAVFGIQTLPVNVATITIIQASLAGVLKSASITLTPIIPAALTFVPSSVTGGSTVTGTVTLVAPAPGSGVTVTLSCNNPAAVPPYSVHVSAGQTSASFTVQTNPTATTDSATVFATLNGMVRQAQITINAPIPTSIGLTPSSVVGGNKVTCTVVLSGVTPNGGMPVTLVSSHPCLTPPGSVVVPVGQNSVSFPVSTSAVLQPIQPTLTATAGGASKTATMTVNPASVVSLAFNPASVTGGSPTTGMITLSGPAPSGGLAVTLTSSNTAVATALATATVLAGATAGSFAVTTKPVSVTTSVVITASAGGSSQTATMTVNPASVVSLAFNPASVIGGSPTTGMITLSGPAPSGGLVVTLTSSNTAVATPPATATVLAGATTGSFAVTTKPVTAASTVTITAKAGGVNNAATLTVNPPAAVLTGVSLTPTNVTGGSPSTGTISLSGSAPAGGLVVTLSSSNTAAAIVPATATVPAGAITATFTVTTKSVSAVALVTITVTSNGTDKTGALTVIPTGVPSGVIAAANGSVITLKWNPVSGATGYWVKWALKNGGPFTKLSALTTTTSISLTGAVAGVTYYYEVSAVNGVGEGANSAQVSVTPILVGLPAVPIGVTATANGSIITITWNAVSGATGYWVKWALKNGGPFTKLSTLTTGTSINLTGAVAGVTYYYEVSAVNGVGEGANSAQVSVTPILAGLPAVPIGVIATANGSVITLKWNPVSGATGYWVKWALKNGGPFTKLSALTTTTSINLTGAVAGVTYYYEVSAVNGVGEGANSAQVSVTPILVGLPAVPIGVTATANGSIITIIWNAVSGATGYWVKWALKNGGPFTKLSTLTTGTSINLPGAVAGVTYYYEVSAVNGVGEGANSAQVSVTPILVGLPAVPIGVTATANGSIITITWNPVSGATGYWVKWALKNGGPFTKLSTLTTGTSINLTGAVAGVTYYYEVSAVNGVGEGPNSAQVNVMD